MAESKVFMKALHVIAGQMLSSELDLEDFPDPDYETGFDECVKTARTALTSTKEALDA